MKYKVKEEFSSLPPERLITIAMGEKEPFTLDSKPFERVLPASKVGPENRTVIKPATQAQLKKLFDFGHPMIEEVPTTAKNS